MILSRAIGSFLAGLLTFALLAIAPPGLVPSANAEMNHASTDQECLSGCVNNSFSQPPAVPSQRPEEEQNKDSKFRPEPYYLQFNHFHVPRKLASQTHEAFCILRPPDLVKLYAIYRN